MERNFPDIAKRWQNVGEPKRHTANEEKIHKLPKAKPTELPKGMDHVEKDGFKRNFAKLKPSQSARFNPPGSAVPNEAESTQDGPPQTAPGAFPGKMSNKPESLSPITARQVKIASNIKR